MKSGKKCFMKLHFSDPFSMNSTFLFLIIPPTQERGSVSGLIKKSNTCIDGCVFKHCICLAMTNYCFTHTYTYRVCICDCRNLCTHLYTIDTHTPYPFKRQCIYIYMYAHSIPTCILSGANLDLDSSVLNVESSKHA